MLKSPHMRNGNDSPATKTNSLLRLKLGLSGVLSLHELIAVLLSRRDDYRIGHGDTLALCTLTLFVFSTFVIQYVAHQ